MRRLSNKVSGKFEVGAPIHRVAGNSVTERGEATPHVFYLTIPCTVAKPDRLTPLYLVDVDANGKVTSAVWQCRDCAEIFYTRRSWAKHVGLVINVMGKCKVLYPPKEDEESAQDLEAYDYGDDLESFL